MWLVQCTVARTLASGFPERPVRGWERHKSRRSEAAPTICQENVSFPDPVFLLCFGPLIFLTRFRSLSVRCPPSPKYVYSFGSGKADGRADMKDLLGGKGANLAEMSSIGIPVPPGFTITTEVCQDYYAANQTLPEAVKPQVEAGSQAGRGAGRQEVRRRLGSRCWSASAPVRRCRCQG